MRFTEQKKKFKQDLKRESRGRYRRIIAGELWDVIDALANDIPLDPSYEDHPLHHNLEGSRDCHLSHDLVLIYTLKDEDTLILERLGTHSEIFGL